MLHLIKIELKKHKFSGTLITMVIAILAIFSFTLLVGYTEEEQAFGDYADALSIIELLVTATFVVYASVLLSRFVVDEFRNKTISILFMYPVSRKKLILAKLLIVCTLTFALIVISSVLVSIGFYFVNERWPVVQDALTTDLVMRQAFHLVFNAFAASCLSLIPLFFGMRKKSVPATIVSSILIVMIFFVGGPQLARSHIAVPITLGLIGVIIAYFTTRKAVRADL